MIIDTHVHLARKGIASDRLWKGYAAFGTPIEEVTGDDLIKVMDEAKIDKSLIIGIDMGLSPYVGEGSISVEEQNKLIAETVQEHSGRLLGVAGIDPRRGVAGIELLDKCVKQWGMVGLKFHPTYGFYPNDRMCYPFYEKCLELDIPVFIHTGPELVVPMKYAQPIYVDDVAVDFPELKIVMIHSGLYTWHWEAIGVANYRPNIYLCLTAWQPLLLRFPDEFYRILRMMIALVTSRRILFGSDWPATKSFCSLSRWIDAFRRVPKSAGFEMTTERADAILGGNAARLLKLSL
jgi:predicted TIM-barrel fold metal-dependent hydrolase